MVSVHVAVLSDDQLFQDGLVRVLRAGAVAAIGIRTSKRVMVRRRLIFIAFVALLTVSVGAAH